MNFVFPTVIRVPVIGDFTEDEKNRRAVHELLRKYKDSVFKIELIKEHNFGESKYKSLNMEMHYTGVNDGLMEKYRKELSDLGIQVDICKI